MAQTRLHIADDNASVPGQLRLLPGMEEDRWEAQMTRRRYPHLQNAIDAQNLSAYVVLIEESPQAIVDYSIENNYHLTIDAALGENAALLVKMTYHAG